MNKTLALEELRPAPVTFTLFATGDIVHTFRKITLADQVWVKETFGKPLNEIFKTGNEIPFTELARVWLNQLLDASPFAPETRQVVDRETGESHEMRVTGSQRLMQSVTSDEFEHVLNAFLRCMVNSRSTEEVADAISPELEKKALRADKRAGASSSTRSRIVTEAMVGPGTTSGH